MKEDCYGSHLRLFPLFPWKHWSGKLAPFEQVLSWPAGTSLFVGWGAGNPLKVPNSETAYWAVLRIIKCA